MSKLDDEVGFNKQPGKYSGDSEGALETIDRMRLMCRNWAGAAGLTMSDLAHPDEIESLNTDFLGDLMFLGFCITTEFKYDDRAGKKLANVEEIDLQKASWYNQMGEHVQGKGDDPRMARFGWSPRVEFEPLWPVTLESQDLEEVEADVRGWTDDKTYWIFRCPFCGSMGTAPDSSKTIRAHHACDERGEIWLISARPFKPVVHKESWEDTTCPVALCSECGQPWPCEHAQCVDRRAVLWAMHVEKLID